MSTIVQDCPRCGSKKITFDVLAQQYLYQSYQWQNHYEVYCVCRACHQGTVFFIAMKEYGLREIFQKPNAIVGYQGDLTANFQCDGYVSLKDSPTRSPPDHLPKIIVDAFNEAARCMSVAAYNGAASMFRLCLDFATTPLLPLPDAKDQKQPNEKQRRDLGLKLVWLFENGLLPENLRELAKCIREDGNDGAHKGNLQKADAEDIADFTFELLDRLVSENERIKLAEQRRMARRAPKTEAKTDRA